MTQRDREMPEFSAWREVVVSPQLSSLLKRHSQVPTLLYDAVYVTLQLTTYFQDHLSATMPYNQANNYYRQLNSWAS